MMYMWCIFYNGYTYKKKYILQWSRVSTYIYWIPNTLWVVCHVGHTWWIHLNKSGSGVVSYENLDKFSRALTNTKVGHMAYSCQLPYTKMSREKSVDGDSLIHNKNL